MRNKNEKKQQRNIDKMGKQAYNSSINAAEILP
jgi:hypothetical protein